MRMNELVDILNDCCNDVTFSFSGKPCGIMPEVHDYVKTYHLWYGEKTIDCGTVEDIMTTKFFDGKSLKEIYEEIDVIAE